METKETEEKSRNEEHKTVKKSTRNKYDWPALKSIGQVDKDTQPERNYRIRTKARGRSLLDSGYIKIRPDKEGNWNDIVKEMKTKVDIRSNGIVIRDIQKTIDGSVKVKIETSKKEEKEELIKKK